MTKYRRIILIYRYFVLYLIIFIIYLLLKFNKLIKEVTYYYKIFNTYTYTYINVKAMSRGEIMTEQSAKSTKSNKSVKRNIDDIRTWAYPGIPGGVTVIRKLNVSEEEIYDIYKNCIEIQRNAYIRALTQQISNSQPN